MWTLVLFLAAFGTVPVSADTVKFIEGPVLLRFNRSHTVVRCSIEVTGSVTPRIDFYINGTLSSKRPLLSCNSEYVQPYQLEDSSVPSQCIVNNTDGEMKRRVHQAMTVRTCRGTPSSFDPIAIKCIVRSDLDPTVNGTGSNTMQLSYNEKYEPCVSAQEGEAVIFLPDPVCPNEDLGKICLQTPPGTTITPPPPPPPSPSKSSAQPAVTPSPSSTPILPTTGVDPSGPLSEGKWMLIVYVVSGAAAFFALLVVCLAGMLCCMVVKKHHMRKAAAPLAEGRRDEVGMCTVLSVGGSGWHGNEFRVSGVVWSECRVSGVV